MFHVKHRWGQLIGWLLGLITPAPAIKLPDIVIPAEDVDVPRETS